MKFPLMSKAMALGAVLMGLLWALWSVQDVVRERDARRDEAERSVVNSLAGAQTVLGPVLLRRCTEQWPVESGEGANRKITMERRDVQLSLLPRTLTVNAGASMEPRYRGLFKVNGYALKATADVQWSDLGALELKVEHPGGRVQCEDPIVSVALSDARGIRLAQLQVQGVALAVQPGTGHALHAQGFHARVNPDQWSPQGLWRAVLTMEVAGTRSLSFVPLADRTDVSLHSPWPHPSFGGRFLPAERQITAQGFKAQWRLSSLASSAQQDFYKGAALCASSQSYAQTRIDHADGADEAADTKTVPCIESFGVDWMDPVNPYVLSDRATKYGLLFISLTFVGVILVEALKRLRVHPIQYLLVGLALTMFFLLLVSLSEHMAFVWAYALASVACTLLLTYYATHILGGWRSGLGFGAGMGMLYGLLYSLLQMEQTALVLGSLMLFVVLSAVMVLTRRMDWYALIAQLSAGPQGERAVSEAP